MTRRTSRYMPPSRSAAQHISPIQPPLNPKNRSANVSVGSVPALSEERGVAPVTPSKVFDAEKRGSENAETVFAAGNATHVDISPGHEVRHAARAESAGLMKFFPSPPKSIFATTMAKKAPKTASQYGATIGRLKAKRIPVTTHERSNTVFFLFLILLKSVSKSTQERTLTSTSVNARSPKKTTAATSAGTSAITTSSITLRTVVFAL